MYEYLTVFLYYYNYLTIFYFLGINSSYLILNFLSFFAIRRYMIMSKVIKPDIIFKSNFYFPISLLIPAYNEGKMIVENVKSMLQLHYPEYEIIVINDGSKDNTAEALIAAYKMISVPREQSSFISTRAVRGIYVSTIYKHLILIDKVNGGKADALNAGINYSKHPLFCALDADSILENQSLLKISRPFIEYSDVVAVGGIIRVVNGCTTKSGEITNIDMPKSMLAKFQIIEYLRAFLFGRTGWSVLNSLLIISGAFGLFKKKEVAEAGGYKVGSLGEDFELVLRLYELYQPKKNIKVTFVPDPVCFTEVPETFEILSKQRRRWQKGLISSLLEHRGLLFNPRYGNVGLIAVPFFFIFELIGPIIESIGYIVFIISYFLGIVNYEIAVLFLICAFSIGVILSTSAIILEEISFQKYPDLKHLVILLFCSIIENFGYRQINSYYRFIATFEYLLGHKKSWGEMSRQGFQK